MDSEEQKMWRFIEVYLKKVPPVFWVTWCGRCQDEAARKHVESVLFHDDSLRNLTDAAVKREVLDAIRQEPAMMQIVIADLAEEVAKYEKDEPVA